MNNINIIICLLIFLILIISFKINEKFENNNNLEKLFNKEGELTTEEINILNKNLIIKRNLKNENNFHNNLVISAIYCQENDFIEEWLNYHLNLKEIDHIYLYSNCKDDSFKKISKFIESGQITWIDFTHLKKKGIGAVRRKPQYFSLNHNYNNFKHEYNYILHIDIDEFLNIKKNNLIQYLDDNKNIGNFKISRYDFSGNNKIEKQDNVLDSYYYREKNPSSFKSIGRITDITIKKNKNPDNSILNHLSEENHVASCHEFFTKKLSKNIPEDICKLHHYKLKSLEEYIKRPSNVTGGRKSTKEQWEELNKKLHKIKDMSLTNL